MAQSNNSNRLVVPGAQNAIDQMKYEIANEFGVNLGPDTTARANGSVGGEITKRLVKMDKNKCLVLHIITNSNTRIVFLIKEDYSFFTSVERAYIFLIISLEILFLCTKLCTI